MRLFFLFLALPCLTAANTIHHNILRGGGKPSDTDHEHKILDARVSLAVDQEMLPAEIKHDDELSDENLFNGTAPFNVTSILVSTATWLRKKNPAAYFALATMLVTHSKSNAAKRSDLVDLRNQVELGDDYHIAIVTTAALPWMTGTAVNPLLRAAHLAKAGKRVTLMVPWLHPLEQRMIFPNGLEFAEPNEQLEHMHAWLLERAGLTKRSLDNRLSLRFYPGRYDGERGSILPLGDITRFIDPSETDICVLEEPEHLTWYHNGPNWRHRFKLVVGVVHTNYIFYARTWASGGPLLAETLKAVNQFMCQAYCDKVIKLSDTLQPLPRAIVCNVHGVRGDFLEIGRRQGRRRFRKGAYFLGKVLWAKGHRLLLDYLQRQVDKGGVPTHVDIFGHGEDLDDVRAEANERGLDLSFHGPTDHAGKTLREYKVFVNPSQSEVLSTTTAEALAMGKFVVIQRHPSNDFFMGFSNTLAYETEDEFLMQLKYALDNNPSPLSAEERLRLSWEGATDRFLDAVTNSSVGSPLPSLGDHTARWVHQGMQNGGVLSDAIRYATGAGPVSRQSWLPKHLERNAQATCTEIVELSIKHSPPESAVAEEDEAVKEVKAAPAAFLNATNAKAAVEDFAEQIAEVWRQMCAFEREYDYSVMDA